MELIEITNDFQTRFEKWRPNDELAGYPFVENEFSPFTTAKRALPMLNLALISSAGGYIDGTEKFDLDAPDGDLSYREIPVEVEAGAMRYAAKGYDPKSVNEDRNSQIPIDRLIAYQENAVIGRLNGVFWSTSSNIPNAQRVADDLTPALAERLHRYEVQAALLIPATRLCHQTLGIVARGIEQSGIPTILLSVDPTMTDRVRPPRSAYYDGELGSVVGPPHWKEYQMRILDQALRWIETYDQPGTRKLSVEIQSKVEAARGER